MEPEKKTRLEFKIDPVKLGNMYPLYSCTDSPERLWIKQKELLCPLRWYPDRKPLLEDILNGEIYRRLETETLLNNDSFGRGVVGKYICHLGPDGIYRGGLRTPYVQGEQ